VSRRSLSRSGALAALLLAATATHAATAWTTDPAQSRLDFTATLAGGDFDGAFRRFAADIEFDPADLEGSRFRVEIDTASAETGDADRDLALKAPTSSPSIAGRARNSRPIASSRSATGASRRWDS